MSPFLRYAKSVFSFQPLAISWLGVTLSLLPPIQRYCGMNFIYEHSFFQPPINPSFHSVTLRFLFIISWITQSSNPSPFHRPHTALHNITWIHMQSLIQLLPAETPPELTRIWRPIIPTATFRQFVHLTSWRRL
jgi:hypothetical protein